MINNNTEDLTDKIIRILKNNKKRIYTIKELATLTNVFPIDVEMCVRQLSLEEMVNVKWKEVYRRKKLVDHKLCVSYSRNCQVKGDRVRNSPMVMYG